MTLAVGRWLPAGSSASVIQQQAPAASHQLVVEDGSLGDDL
jgi:hypothetical protein